MEFEFGSLKSKAMIIPEPTLDHMVGSDPYSLWASHINAEVPLALNVPQDNTEGPGMVTAYLCCLPDSHTKSIQVEAHTCTLCNIPGS